MLYGTAGVKAIVVLWVCENIIQYYKKDACFFKQSLKQGMTYGKMRTAKKN